ncbi:MAG: FAD-dependent oxidoreductase, partial [Solirubrobacterales bacterium]
MAGTEAKVSVDVAIVGAGLSGLSAARRLRAGARTVIVLEARDRVGGKMRTEPVGGHDADLGAHWIGPTQDRVAALARELG